VGCEKKANKNEGDGRMKLLKKQSKIKFEKYLKNLRLGGSSLYTTEDRKKEKRLG